MGLQQELLRLNSHIVAIEERLDGLEIHLTKAGQSESPSADPITVQVVELAAQGLSVREIARELGQSKSTIHRRLRTIAADEYAVRASASWSTST